MQIALVDVRAGVGQFYWEGAPVAAQVFARADTPVAEYLDEVLSLAGAAEVEVLYVFCHANSIWNGGVNIPLIDVNVGGTPAGNAGLQLGAALVRTKDLDAWSVLKGTVRRIELLACRAASTHPKVPSADGLKFCSKMARVTGAYVRASPAEQEAEIDTDVINPWPMEGPIYCFDPNGGTYYQEAP